MRDPNRIEQFLQELGDIWKTECPDWRFGQFINNVFSSMGRNTLFMEDKEMMEKIKEYFNIHD